MSPQFMLRMLPLGKGPLVGETVQPVIQDESLHSKMKSEGAIAAEISTYNKYYIIRLNRYDELA